GKRPFLPSAGGQTAADRRHLVGWMKSVYNGGTSQTERQPMSSDAYQAETAVSAPQDSFQTEQVMTVAGGHFVHDTYSAFVATLLPRLQEQLGAGYALTGSLAIYIQLPSLLNPFIGYLADKVSLRYFIIFAPAVTATFVSALGLTSDYLVLAMLLLAAGVSTAAFHAPAPAMVARLSGVQTGKGMSLFMACGELGRTLGPVVVTAGLGWFGLSGLWRLAFVGWAVSGILFWRLHDVSARPVAAQQMTQRLETFWPGARRLFPLLAWLLAARVLMLVALTTYLPLFMTDARAGTPWLAAGALSVLEGAGVVGALTTGTLSDRVGRRRLLLLLFGVAPLLLLAFVLGPTWLALPLLIGLGLTAISTQPVLLAMVQDQFPQHRALANGTFIGLSFLIRALGVWVIGLLADAYGLNAAFLWGAAVVWLGLPAVWRLPR
ncbi:MAG: MFS transporter, partial [Anaerolineales bacterium]|nr:MFS transporter [Anaerolineales bacterium]